MKEKLILRPTQIISVFEALSTIPKNLDIIKAKEIWEKSDHGKGNTVAIIDTGVEKEHPNLVSNIIGGYNFTDDDGGNPEIFRDYRGHGTHVAGIVAACECENNEGIVGVAPKSKLLILKAIDRNGVGSYENLVNALLYAINWSGPNGEKVNVINMSLGGPTHNEDLYKAIKQAREKGIVLVSAAGNHGDGNYQSFERSYPGYYKEVIQIGSVTKTLKPSVFSNTNVNLDFVAPGENVISTHLNNKFVELTGTSMAAPYVAGGVALVLNLIDRSQPAMVPYLIYQYLVERVKKLDYPISQVGNGLIQLT
ncbi:major intracellular serine protease [Bacillus thermophilus]|uniref:Major intracellular serine protease n=1 Tax=Siminovitchia thermophila TaxID=1245522 RepID=A0ABS2R6S0_9BACI|nr:S8 family peptidase [Siminovitchia thermophila]MBM7715313.1 major intracellular serine protease [Siminovitchia thermophila]